MRNASEPVEEVLNRNSARQQCGGRKDHPAGKADQEKRETPVAAYIKESYI